MGFPRPSKDYEVNDIDLPAYLVPHPLASYFVRVTSSGMEKFHIPKNSLLIVDRTVKVDHDKFVVVDVDGERTVRRLVKSPRSWVLENGYGKPTVIKDGMTVEFFGVVTKIIIEP